MQAIWVGRHDRCIAQLPGQSQGFVTFVGAIPGETLTLPTDIYQATQSPGDEGRALALCLISAALAVGAILASELVARQMVGKARP